ncbi:MAG: MnhB domain-containing protein [Thermoleophilia bacterium]|nr:MnhB domain-containing protein [Thermoleophilia bacterium]
MTGPLVETVSRLLLAPTLVVALAILVKGYSDVGDGFTAGVVAALGVVLQYTALGSSRVRRALPVGAALPVALAGLALALGVAFLPLLWGAAPVTHYPRPGSSVVHVGTAELLTAVAFDIGVFLLVLGAAVGIVDAVAGAETKR